VTGAPRANRLFLRSAMLAAGFTDYRNEWWHFTLDKEPYPSTYFDFPVSR
jgi:D-alanyl-D-alanine dipeptidase